MSGTYLRRLGAAAAAALCLAITACSIPAPQYMKDLPKVERSRLQSLDERILWHFSERAVDETSDSPLFVDRLKPSKALKGKIPGGKYKDGCRYLDARVFENTERDQVMLRIGIHETLHHLTFLIDMERFRTWYTKNEGSYIVKHVEGILEAYDFKHSHPWRERVAYVGQFLAIGTYAFDSETTEIFKPVLAVAKIDRVLDEIALQARRH